MSCYIKFYKVNDPFGCFSNFSKHSFNLDDETWLTAEHYFQSRKFLDENIKEKIRAVASPMDAALLGRNRNYTLVQNWESIKDDVMRVAVFEKFSQNDDIKEILLSTGDAIIIEHTRNDSYWGDGGDGSGKNMLGLILMQTREKLRGG